MDNTNLNDVNRIASGTVFKGELTSNNDIRIDGTFDGHLESKGRLVVGEAAVVIGDIICTNVDFSGTMKEGTFFVKDTLSLKTGCSVNGTLRFKRLQVELDAKINGTCQVINEKDEARPAAPQDKAHPVNKPAEHNGTVEEK